MAALFQMLFVSRAAAAEPTAVATAKSSSPMLQSPRSYHLPAYPDAREWDERQRRASAGASATETRIARWDNKREKCANCKHIYLKTLSRHAGYCSVDCKSNAAYLDKVNRTIKAVRSAAEHKRQQEEEEDAVPEPQSKDSEAPSEHVEATTRAQTFSEFGLEGRLPTEQNVEWAFSAMY